MLGVQELEMDFVIRWAQMDVGTKSLGQVILFLSEYYFGSSFSNEFSIKMCCVEMVQAEK